MGIETALIIGGAAAIGGAVASVALKARMKTPSNEMDRGIELARRLDPDYPREVAVGLFSTGGSGAYDCVSGTDDDGQPNNKYLYRVTILSDFEITAFRELRLDGEKMRLSGDPMQGWVDVLDRYQKGGDDVTPGPAVRIRVMAGTEDQALDPELAAAVPLDDNGQKELLATDRFAGMAYAIIRYEANPEAFQGGEPQAFFVGEGAPVHDPSDPASDPNDSSTWSRTSSARFNASLVAAQAMRGWKRNGEVIVGADGLHLFDIPEAPLQEAAAICDEPRATPTGTEPRYRVGGMVRMDPEQGIRPSLVKIFAAMDGELIEDGGQFIILPGAPRVPVAHFDLQAIGGQTLAPFDPHGSSTSRHNRCECTFVDPEAGYGEQPLKVYAPAAYLQDDDDRPKTMKIELEMVPYRYQAAAIQKQRLDRSRLVGKAKFDLPLIAKKLQPGDWFTVTDAVTGLVASVWEADQCERTDSEEDGSRVIVSASAIDVTPYQYSQSDAQAAIGVITAPPSQTFPGLTAPVLTLTPIYVEGGGAKEPAIKVEAAVPDAPLADHIDFEWRQKTSPDRLYVRSIDKARGGFVIREGIVPGAVFEVRARLTSLGRKGSWSAWREETAPSEYWVPGLGGFDADHWANLIATAESAGNAAGQAASDAQQAANAAQATADELAVEVAEATQNLSPGAESIGEAATAVREEIRKGRKRTGRVLAEVAASLSLLLTGHAEAADENILRKSEIIQLSERADGIEVVATQALDATIDLEANKASLTAVTALEGIVGADDGQGDLVSRTGAVEALAASLEVDKAEATRVASLEALVGADDGQGALVGRLSAAESAVADLEAGKVEVTTFNLVEARVSGVEAQADAADSAIAQAVASIEALEKATATAERASARRFQRILAEIAAGSAESVEGISAVSDGLRVEIERVSALIARAGSAEARLDSNEQAIVDLENGKAEASALQSVSASLAAAEGEIDALQAEFAGGGRVTLAEADVSTLQGAVVDLESGKAEASTVAALQALVGADDGQGALVGRLSAAESAVADLEAGKVEVTTFNLVEARVSGVEAQADAADSAIADVVASVAELNEANAASNRASARRLQRILAEIAAGTAQAVDGVSAVSDGLVVEAKRVSDLGVRASDAEARLSTNEQAIIDLESGKAEASALQSVSAALSTAEGEIDALQAEFAGGGRVPAIEADVTGLQTAVVDLENGKAEATALQSVSASLSAAEGEIDALQAEFAGGGRVSLVEADVTGLQTAVIDLENGKAEATTVAALQALVGSDDGQGALFSRMSSVEQAAVDLENGKAEASVVAALSATVNQNSADILVNAQTIATLEGAAAIYEILVSASGGNPAIARLLAGVNGSEIAFAADVLRLLNTGDNSVIEAMRVQNGVVEIIQALVLATGSVIKSADGRMEIGFLTGGGFGIKFKNANGDDVLVLDTINEVFDVSASALAAGSLGAEQSSFTSSFTSSKYALTGSGDVADFNSLTRTTPEIPVSPGSKVKVSASYEIVTGAQKFTLFTYIDRLRILGGVGSSGQKQNFGTRYLRMGASANNSVPNEYGAGDVTDEKSSRGELVVPSPLSGAWVGTTSIKAELFWGPWNSGRSDTRCIHQLSAFGATDLVLKNVLVTIQARTSGPYIV